MSQRLRPLPVAGLALGALVFAGCATGVSVDPGDPPPTGPAGVEIEVDAAWLAGGSIIALVTQGSSTPSCAYIVGDVSAQGQTVTVELEDHPDIDRGCDGDLGRRVSLAALPEGIDATQDVQIVVTGDGISGETDLDGLPPGIEVEEFAPSAGWVDDGLFAILTYGSSSCVPVVESVEATSATAVTVTFVEPPADQVCTMDLAPRVALASVDGVDDDALVELTLTGGGAEFETPVTIPIHG